MNHFKINITSSYHLTLVFITKLIGKLELILKIELIFTIQIDEIQLN